MQRHAGAASLMTSKCSGDETKYTGKFCRFGSIRQSQQIVYDRQLAVSELQLDTQDNEPTVLSSLVTALPSKNLAVALLYGMMFQDQQLQVRGFTKGCCKACVRVERRDV